MGDEDLKQLVNTPQRKRGEFREGDIVSCWKEGKYRKTDVGIKCRVESVDGNELWVEIIEDNGDYGEEYGVQAKYFELLEESQA